MKRVVQDVKYVEVQNADNMKKLKKLKVYVDKWVDLNELTKFIELNSDMSWNEVCDLTGKWMEFCESNEENIEYKGSHNPALQKYIDEFLTVHSDELDGDDSVLIKFTD